MIRNTPQIARTTDSKKWHDKLVQAGWDAGPYAKISNSIIKQIKINGKWVAR